MPIMIRRALAVVAVLLLTAPAAQAQQQGPPPCSADEFRQFDFWIGDWEVTSIANGSLAGTNTIEPILGGCVLWEQYETPSGYSGFSYNSYDRQTGQWHQTWVDNGGLVLKIDGGIVDGAMVLEGPGKDQQGNDILNRITWTPHADGAVQQTWDISSDGGSTWTTAFDGMYRKVSERDGDG